MTTIPTKIFSIYKTSEISFFHVFTFYFGAFIACFSLMFLFMPIGDYFGFGIGFGYLAMIFIFILYIWIISKHHDWISAYADLIINNDGCSIEMIREGYYVSFTNFSFTWDELKTFHFNYRTGYIFELSNGDILNFNDTSNSVYNSLIKFLLIHVHQKAGKIEERF